MSDRASKGANRKHGRNEAKCKRYKLEQRREKHKIKRILKSSREAARLYADDHGLASYFRGLT